MKTQLTFEVEGSPDVIADKVRAIVMAIERPQAVLEADDRVAEANALRNEMREDRDELEKSLRAEIGRLEARVRADDALIAGLRAELEACRKVSPVPATAQVTPPDQTGQASEDVLNQGESPQEAGHGGAEVERAAGPHSPVLRVSASAEARAGDLAPVLRVGEGADGPDAAGARAAQPGANGGAAQAPGGEGRGGEGGAGDVAETDSHKDLGGAGKRVAADDEIRTARGQDPEASGEEQDREADAGRVAGDGSGNGGPPTVPAAATAVGDEQQTGGVAETTASSESPKLVEPGSIPGRPASNPMKVPQQGERWVNTDSMRIGIVEYADLAGADPDRQPVAFRDAESGRLAHTAMSRVGPGKRWRFLGGTCIAPSCPSEGRATAPTCLLHAVDESIQSEWLRDWLGIRPRARTKKPEVAVA